MIPCLGLVALAQSPPLTDEGITKDFTTWLERQPPDSKPGDLIASYHDSLRREGIPDQEARRKMRIVFDFIFAQFGFEIQYHPPATGLPVCVFRSFFLQCKP